MNGESGISLAPRAMLPRTAVARRGCRLHYLTIVWNSAECVIALAAELLAGSIALVGFGFDSAIEVTSSIAAIWRLHREASPCGCRRRRDGTVAACSAPEGDMDCPDT